MLRLFSFDGTLTRHAYAGAALATLFLPHLAILAVETGLRQAPDLSVVFLLLPFRWGLEQIGRHPLGPLEAGALAIGGFAVTILTAWIMAALAVRRANDARVSGWLAVLAIAPVLQFAVVPVLACLPGRAAKTPDAGIPPGARRPWVATLQGLLGAVGLTLLAVVIGAPILGSYGYAMFTLSPVVIGALSAFMANRDGDIGWRATACIVTAAMALGGFALLATALEGGVCIVMAAPLAWGMGLVGGAVGRAIARATRQGGGHPTLSIALIPLLFLSDQALRPTSSFTDDISIEIAAAPAIVWQAVLRTDTIGAEPALPFRLGIAYPLRGEVFGEGVGAIRLGYFSTGVAVERITEWAPGRALGFVILSEPPSLRELSPYAHVYVPHVDGYFRSTQARIALQETAPGHTRLTLTTAHELDLQPTLYWMPVASWVVRQNKIRVLGQIRRQAEAAAPSGS